MLSTEYKRFSIFFSISLSVKYAHIENGTNKLLGWYTKEIHSKIPTPNIEVTDEVWLEALNTNANCYENGEFIVKDYTTDEQREELNNDFSYIENFEDISKFMLENLDSIFNIILNNGKQVISNHKGKTISTNKNLGPMM